MTLKLATILSVYNEKDFLEQFISHYDSQVDTMFVIDNESTDGSTKGLASRHPKVVLSSYATGGHYDDTCKHQMLLDKKAECVGQYDYVILLDADEFIHPKKGRSIKETIERTGRRDVYGTDGWNLYTYPGDPIYDPSRPILNQRRRGVPNAHYSKPVIVRPELDAKYVLGCHWIDNIQDPSLKDPDRVEFWLYHLRGFDDEIFIRRSFERISRMVVPWPGHYYWNVSEDDLRKRILYEKTATTIRTVVPEGVYEGPVR